MLKIFPNLSGIFIFIAFLCFLIIFLFKLDFKMIDMELSSFPTFGAIIISTLLLGGMCLSECAPQNRQLLSYIGPTNNYVKTNKCINATIISQQVSSIASDSFILLKNNKTNKLFKIKKSSYSNFDKFNVKTGKKYQITITHYKFASAFSLNRDRNRTNDKVSSIRQID